MLYRGQRSAKLQINTLTHPALSSYTHTMTALQPPYRFTHAIVRAPHPCVINGLRDGNGDDPTFEGVLNEHHAYLAAMHAAGVEIIKLPALNNLPDAVFVEDPALVFSEGAILLHTDAATRTQEAVHIATDLTRHFDKVLSMSTEGAAEGGDILRTPKEVLIGLSARTNMAGATELQSLLDELGHQSRIVQTPPGVLHFKTDCSLLDEHRVLSTRRLASSGVFNDFECLLVPEGEEAAANALRVNDVVLIGEHFIHTRNLLERSGYNVVPLPVQEIGKIDAGLSCMSLRWYQS